MKKFKCECCGAPLKPSLYKTDEWVCEYCGMMYKQEHEELPPIRIETFQNPCKTYEVSMLIPIHEIKYIGEENVSELAIRQLSRNLAEAIAPNMELYTEYDPISISQRITAKIRIVEPNYRF